MTCADLSPHPAALPGPRGTDVHLDETWIDWADASPCPPVGPSIGCAGGGEAGEGPPGLDLMAFLSDFRGGLYADVDTPQAECGGGTAMVPAGVGPAASRQGPDWHDDPYLGSDVQVDPSWWVASDRRWYPPELHPDRIQEASRLPSEEPAPAAI